MRNRVPGIALLGVKSLGSTLAAATLLAGCSSIGGFGGSAQQATVSPLTTGATTAAASANLGQPMPSVLASPQSDTAPYLPPADIGGQNAVAPLSANMTATATSVQSQTLPPLPSSGSSPSMSAQPSSKPVTIASGTSPASVQSTPSAPALRAVPDNAYVHQIQSGESLYSIARQYKVSTNELIAANGLVAPYTLFVGQKLLIPGHVAAAPAIVKTAKAEIKTPSAAEVQPAQLQPVQPAPGLDRRIMTASTHTTPEPIHKAEPSVAPSVTKTVTEPVQKTASVATKPAPVQTGDAGGEFRWPVNGSVITDFASSKSGINIAAKEGTAVRAADAGTVIYVGNAVEGFGNLILIKHDNGYVSAYAHLKDANVSKGQKVARGQAIGSVGMTGSVSRPQLHFELREGATPVDPVPLMAG